jgi:hypothetical protein
VRAEAETILAGTLHADPDVTILCAGDAETAQYFSEICGVRVVPFSRGRRRKVIDELRRTGFEVQHTFWTGERGRRRLRLAGLLIGASGETRVHIGDGGSFRLTWKAIIRHAMFRVQHRLPTDHYEFVPPADKPVVARYPGERILIVQSADPEHIVRALRHLDERPVFREPRYTLFCRNTPETLRQLAGHPMLHSIETHTETRGTWKHFRDLRRERYDAAVLFCTGDPSYWKIKYFAFTLGARHILIFNENNDCFFFTIRAFVRLLAHRLAQRSRTGSGPHWSWTHHMRVAAFMATKLLLLPFRFTWLLLVWCRLRSAARRA